METRLSQNKKDIVPYPVHSFQVFLSKTILMLSFN
jgi:hypothetical protein